MRYISHFIQDDPEQKPRNEDDSISYTWREFLDNPGMTPEVILEFPQGKVAFIFTLKMELRRHRIPFCM